MALLSLALLSPAIDLPQWRLDAAYAESVLGDQGYTAGVVLRHWSRRAAQRALGYGAACAPNAPLYEALWGAGEEAALTASFDVVVPDVPELIIALRDQLAAVAEEAH